MRCPRGGLSAGAHNRPARPPQPEGRRHGAPPYFRDVPGWCRAGRTPPTRKAGRRRRPPRGWPGHCRGAVAVGGAPAGSASAWPNACCATVNSGRVQLRGKPGEPGKGNEKRHPSRGKKSDFFQKSLNQLPTKGLLISMLRTIPTKTHVFRGVKCMGIVHCQGDLACGEPGSWQRSPRSRLGLLPRRRASPKLFRRGPRGRATAARAWADGKVERRRRLVPSVRMGLPAVHLRCASTSSVPLSEGAGQGGCGARWGESQVNHRREPLHPLAARRIGASGWRALTTSSG
jgi:hypothetical protein